MARFRQGMYLRPVQRVKHVVDKQGGLVAGTKDVTTVITSVDTPALADTDGVATGSTVHGIFLNIQVAPTNAVALANVYMHVMKNPGGNLSTTNGNTIGAQDIKKYVIHQEMAMMSGSTDPFPTTLFRGVIKIPKGYKRNGTNDLLQIILYSPGVTVDFCIQCIYQEYR